MDRGLRRSIFMSYLIGAPIGLFVVFATILIPPFLGAGMFTIALLAVYGLPTVGLVLAFLVSLWIGGKIAYKNIVKGTSLLLTSLKYSTIVNLIIWTVFCLVLVLTFEKEKALILFPAIVAFFVCTILTTFSIGLLISYTIKKTYEKAKMSV
ncbi:hypothetical protein [Kordia sp.]|uniref:hypothetical protein n=1 Tax=Kordia sp. TaxID=1965332 RepID=UPI003B5B7803